MTLELSVAQLNFTVGDMAGNAQKIMDAARRAYANGVRLLITPELSICGYAAEDLFLRASFITAWKISSQKTENWTAFKTDSLRS